MKKIIKVDEDYINARIDRWIKSEYNSIPQSLIEKNLRLGKIKVNKRILELSSDEQNYEKGEFKHFMAKEIEEQPITLKNCIKEYIDNINNDINIYNFPWNLKEISSVIRIIAFII